MTKKEWKILTGLITTRTQKLSRGALRAADRFVTRAELDLLRDLQSKMTDPT